MLDLLSPPAPPVILASRRPPSRGAAMPIDADSTALDEIALFHDLTADQLAWICGLLHRRTFPAGTNLITADQPGEVVYIILSGTVKINVTQQDGTDVIIAILGAGDTVGEMSLLDSAGRSANVVTQEESTLLWMDRSAFQECLKVVPLITYNLVRVMSGRLRLANEQIQSLATLDVSGRVARQLLAFAQQYGRTAADGSIFVPIRLTQSDLAGLVGASRERVNQAIVDFKQRKYIKVDQNYRVTIYNVPALARRCR
jgi:CRP/FNR family transcriptional regulator, cyclic AMP receptor protein